MMVKKVFIYFVFLLVILTIIFSIKGLYEMLSHPRPLPHVIRPTEFWHDSYNVIESLNMFELPYSEATSHCQVYIDVGFSEVSIPIEEGKEPILFIESVNLDGKELLSKPTTVRYGPSHLILDDKIKKTEGVLIAQMRATKKSNISINMGEVC